MVWHGAQYFKEREDVIFAKFNVVDNDIENDDIVEEGPPALVMYHKKSNEAVVYHGI